MRENTFIGGAGMPGSGKTFANKEQTKKEITKAGPRKVLVIDSQDEYSPQDPDIMKIGVYVKPIHLSQVAAFSNSRFIEACRIRPFNDNGHPMSLTEIAEVLQQVMFNFRDGLLIVEDFKQFAGASTKQDLVNRLCTLRHRCDVLVSLQGVGQFTPIMWQNLKWLRLHKTTDSVTRHEDKFPEKIEFLTIAENIINKKYFEGDERMKLMIDLQRGFIYGRYSQEEFISACRDYVSQNWNRTGGKMMNIRDASGKKMHKEASAMQAVLYRFTHSYSQFSPRLAK